jgi:hypothetical protein
MSIRFVTVAAVSTILAFLIFWRFWKRMVLEFPDSRTKSVAAAFGLLLFSLFPAVFVLDGIGAGQITHYVRGAGPNHIYYLSQQPVLYWLTILLQFAAFLFLFVGFAFMLRSAFKPTSPRPNKAMQATRETRAPDG